MLHNRTTIDGLLLAQILRYGGQLSGANLDNVKIVISRGKYLRGLAINGNPKEMRVIIPKIVKDTIDTTRRIWEVIAHELKHIADYQAKDRGELNIGSSYATPFSSRRMRHDDRPIEKRAIAFTKSVTTKLENECSELFLQLAIALD
jgi:hypothetical protein